MENIRHLPVAPPTPEPRTHAGEWSLDLRLVPMHEAATRVGNRAGALWGLAEALAPDERLSLSYRFHADGPAQATLSLSGAVAYDGADADALARRHALPRLASLAFPGFATVLAPRSPWRHSQDIPLPAVDLLARAMGPAPRLATPRPLDGCLLLPGRPLPRIDLDGALTALAGLDQDAELSVDLAPFALGAVARRFVSHMHDQLLATLVTQQASPFIEAQTAIHVALLALWLRRPVGLKIGYALRSPKPVSHPWAGVVTQLLSGGDGLACVRPEHDGVDLSDAVTAGFQLPPILPGLETLEALGFVDPRPRPRRAATDGVLLGRDPAGRPVVLGRADCARHTCVLGATGVGKSTLIAAMIAQDVAAGHGVILIDPHGDLFAQVRAALPAGRSAMLADVADLDAPFGLNLLEIDGPHPAAQRNMIANQLMGVFKSVLYRDCPEAFGPMFEAYFRNALMLLMEVEGANATLVDFDRVFGEAEYRRGLLSRCEDDVVKRFWTNIATKAGGDASLENIAPYIVCKLTQFTGNPTLRPILAQRRSTLDLAGAMARREVCLVHLAKGLVGPFDAALIGGLVCIRILSAAMARAALPAAQRTPVRVYLDEFATYAGDAVSQMLAEARKFGVELVLVTQSLTQIDGHDGGVDIASAVLANVGNILAFRTGPRDARRLADWFAPEVTAETLTRLPDRTIVARLLDQGTPRAPCRLLTDPA